MIKNWEDSVKKWEKIIEEAETDIVNRSKLYSCVNGECGFCAEFKEKSTCGECPLTKNNFCGTPKPNNVYLQIDDAIWKENYTLILELSLKMLEEIKKYRGLFVEKVF